MQRKKIKELHFGDSFQFDELPFSDSYLFIGYNRKTDLATYFHFHINSGKYEEFVCPGNNIVFVLYKLDDISAIEDDFDDLPF